MTKYDQYIKEFLLKNSELSVEKIGTFTINPVAGTSGERTIQPQNIVFQFNKRAQTTEALIEYIATQTGKNRVLISSDLSSAFEDIRQYANIGKSNTFAGLGNIMLNNKTGEYDFSAGGPMVTVTDTPATYTHPEGEAAGKGQKGRNAVILIAFLIVLLIVGGLGWGIYRYFNQGKTETAVNTDTPNPDSLVSKTVMAKPDTAVSTPAVNVVTGDSATYKFIFETTRSSNRAYKRYDSLRAWKENCLIDSVPRDSGMVYHLYVKIKVPVSDTTAIKDSIQKYYARPNPVIIRHI